MVEMWDHKKAGKKAESKVSMKVEKKALQLVAGMVEKLEYQKVAS